MIRWFGDQGKSRLILSIVGSTCRWALTLLIFVDLCWVGIFHHLLSGYYPHHLLFIEFGVSGCEHSLHHCVYLHFLGSFPLELWMFKVKVTKWLKLHEHYMKPLPLALCVIWFVFCTEYSENVCKPLNNYSCLLHLRSKPQYLVSWVSRAYT